VLVSDLQTTIEKKFGLNHTAEGTYVLKWISEAYRDLHNKIHLGPASISVSITSGTNEYTLATTIEAVEEATVIGSTVKPARVSVAEILDRRRFVNSGVAPGDLFVYAIEGNLLMVYPDPTANYTLTLYGTTEPSTTDFVGTENLTSVLGLIPLQPLLKCLDTFTSARAAEYDDKTLSERAQEYWAQYAQDIKAARRAVRRRAGRGLTGFRAGYPDHTGFPKRNDVYPQLDR
jgi:hypothetical protein